MTSVPAEYEQLTNAYARSALGGGETNGFAKTLAHLAAETALADAGVVTFCRDGSLELAAASTCAARRLEALQRSADGPVLEVIRSGRTVTVDDLTTDPRWSRWAEPAQSLGIRSQTVTPLASDGESLGVVAVFRAAPGAWPDECVIGLERLARLAALLLRVQREVASLRVLNDQLQGALERRILVEQAKGFIAAQLGVTTDHAFSLLRDHARRTNQTVRSMAHAVVEMRVLPAAPSRGGLSHSASAHVAPQ